MALTDNQRRIGAATAAATALAAPLEGIRQVVYYDPPGILTVCRGHTGSDIDPKHHYTLAECDQFMNADMTAKVKAVDKCHPGLPMSVLVAMSDAAYNLGEGIICDKSHTVAQYLYQGKYLQGCYALPLYDKARVAGVMVALPGLTKRRAIEKDICLQDLT